MCVNDKPPRKRENFFLIKRKERREKESPREKEREREVGNLRKNDLPLMSDPLTINTTTTGTTTTRVD